MPAIHTGGNFARLLEPGLTGVMEKHLKELPNMRQVLYNMGKTSKAWDSFWAVGDVPDIPEFTGTITYLTISPGFHTKLEAKEYAGGLQFERKFVEDNQYSVMKSRAKKLVESMNRVQEKSAAGIFNDAFSTSFDFMTSEEGVSLCNSAHLTKSGVSTSSGFSNAGSSALTSTSLAATRLIMKGFRSDIGERISINPNTLILPSELYDTARELVESRLDPDTANNAINPQYGKWKIIDYPLLSDNDTNNWFMSDFAMQKEYLLWRDRVAPETKATMDFETFTLKTSVYSRYACGFIEWRWIYGHEV